MSGTKTPAAEIGVRINGTVRQLAAGSNVADLVATLGRDPRTVAVERNGDIVPRARWSVSALADGDRLEIVHFVQGG